MDELQGPESLVIHAKVSSLPADLAALAIRSSWGGSQQWQRSARPKILQLLQLVLHVQRGEHLPNGPEWRELVGKWVPFNQARTNDRVRRRAFPGTPSVALPFPSVLREHGSSSASRMRAPPLSCFHSRPLTCSLFVHFHPFHRLYGLSLASL